ncbi:glycosyltransferase family 1 protein [Cytidiella melzeri]|nr:glycosyltransferase family 1 protein [Cytidiella melzeri]
MYHVALAIPLALLAALLRLYMILPRAKLTTKGTRPASEPCRIGVFLGSGGHTAEALTLLSALDLTRYNHRTYIVSRGDTLSAKKARTLESLKADAPADNVSPPAYRIITIPRARRVHQSLLTTPFTSVQSLAICVYHVMLVPLLSGERFADVVLLNGPGTCVMVCMAVYVNKFLGLYSPKLVYVESFARVRRLSLSGKLLRHFVDRFVVQWPELAAGDSKADCRGWLV